MNTAKRIALIRLTAFTLLLLCSVLFTQATVIRLNAEFGASSSATEPSTPIASATSGQVANGLLVQAVATQTADMTELHAALDSRISLWQSAAASNLEINQVQYVTPAEAGLSADSRIKIIIYGNCNNYFFILVITDTPQNYSSSVIEGGYEYTTATSPFSCPIPREYVIATAQPTGAGWWFIQAHVNYQPAAPVGPFPTETPVALSGPMLDRTKPQIGQTILKALPARIQNLIKSTDPKQSYVGKGRDGNMDGIVAIYTLDGDETAELGVIIWATPSANQAEDRYLLQYYGMNKGYGFPTTYSKIADESFVAPEAKASQQYALDGIGPVWGSMRFRNVEADLIPTKELTDKLPNFSAADATQIQEAVFVAIQSGFASSTTVPTPGQSVTLTTTMTPAPAISGNHAIPTQITPIQSQTNSDMVELHSALDSRIKSWQSALNPSITSDQEQYVTPADAGLSGDPRINIIIYGKCSGRFFLLVITKNAPFGAIQSGYEYTTASSPASCHIPQYDMTFTQQTGNAWWLVEAQYTYFVPAPATGPSPTRTPVAPLLPPLSQTNQQAALNILNALTPEMLNVTNVLTTLPVQKQTLIKDTDPRKCMIVKDNNGDVQTISCQYYLDSDSTSVLYIRIYILPSANDAEDRYLRQYQLMNERYGFPTTDARVGDESFVAPEATLNQHDSVFVNDPVWGSARERNIEFDLYPNKNLTDKLPNLSPLAISRILDDVYVSIESGFLTPTATTGQ